MISSIGTISGALADAGASVTNMNPLGKSLVDTSKIAGGGSLGFDPVKDPCQAARVTKAQGFPSAVVKAYEARCSQIYGSIKGSAAQGMPSVPINDPPPPPVPLASPPMAYTLGQTQSDAAAAKKKKLMIAAGVGVAALGALVVIIKKRKR